MTRLFKGIAVIGTWIFVLLLLAVDVGAQNVSRELSQIKGQLTILNQDISALKSRLDALEKQMPKSGTAPNQVAAETRTPKAEGASEKRHVRDLVCKAGAKFMAEMDAALNLGDEDAAEDKTDQALAELKSALAPHSQDKRVSRFLSLAGMMAWDVSSAVGLRSSVEGNREFLEYISRYKKRFDLFCEGKAKSE